MFNKRINLDFASITPIDRRVLKVMRKYSAPNYANPSSWYAEGVAAKKSVEMARRKIADFLHAHPDEIVATSGGTEANNLALLGTLKAFRESEPEILIKGAKPHIIISSIEHSSLMELAKELESHGCEVTRLRVNEEGVVDLDELKQSIGPNTFLVSIMTVNNEIGTIQPIREIAKIIRQAKRRLEVRSHQSEEVNSGYDIRNKYPLFHTDAAQAVFSTDLNVEKLGIDLLTLDGSKVYGPRGVGALYIRRETPIRPIIIGGGQESGFRSGTENLPAMAGFARALELFIEERKSLGIRPDQEDGFVLRDPRFSEFRSLLIDGLNATGRVVRVNGPKEAGNVSPNILNVSIAGIDNEFFIFQLDANGVSCSTKSSCLRDEDESYVLKAIGANSNESVRFSFGRKTTKRDIRKVVRVVTKLLRNPA